MKIIFYTVLAVDKHSWDKVCELPPQYDTEVLDLFTQITTSLQSSQL